MIVETKTFLALGALASAAAGGVTEVVIEPALPAQVAQPLLHEALGLEITAIELIVGCMFAVAGGFAALFVTPPKQKLTILQTLFVALFIGLIAALAQDVLGDATGWQFIVNLPVQAVMGLAGAGSRKAIDLMRALTPWQRGGQT